MDDREKQDAIERLERLGDEIKLKAHLLKAELRDEWAKHEHDLARLRAELAPVREAVGESAKDVGAAARLLFQSVKEGLEKIHAAVTSGR